MASLPADVQRAIEAAWPIARDDRRHVLSYHARFLIWNAMGARRRTPGTPATPPHVRRMRLAIACATRALPVWERRWPDRRTPHHALAAADEALALPARWERSMKIADACEMEVEAAYPKDFVAACAGESAAAALRVAIYDESDTDDAVGEGDVQVGGPISDAAGNAAIALANGTAGDPAADPGRRLAFWRWYLAEAVPGVYDAEAIALLG